MPLVHQQGNLKSLWLGSFRVSGEDRHLYTNFSTPTGKREHGEVIESLLEKVVTQGRSGGR